MKIMFASLLLTAVACSSAAPTAGTTSSSTKTAPPAACPAPTQTTDVCAAVETYAKDPAGTCCAYPTPCAVPFSGQQYSDAACTSPSGSPQP
jgi:hypothetical protein